MGLKAGGSARCQPLSQAGQHPQAAPLVRLTSRSVRWDPAYQSKNWDMVGAPK